LESVGWWREVEVFGLGRVHVDVNTDSMNLIDLSCGEWGSIECLFIGEYLVCHFCDNLLRVFSDLTPILRFGIGLFALENTSQKFFFPFLWHKILRLDRDL